jgi:hypothetical protein
MDFGWPRILINLFMDVRMEHTGLTIMTSCTTGSITREEKYGRSGKLLEMFVELPFPRLRKGGP